jgi:hypothetical protein
MKGKENGEIDRHGVEEETYIYVDDETRRNSEFGFWILCAVSAASALVACQIASSQTA